MKILLAGGFCAAVLAGAGMSSSVFAQKTYRCGNTFQSFPCASNNATGGGKADDKAKPAAQSIKIPEPPPPTPEELKAEAAKKAQLAEAKKAEDATKEKKARCDKVRNDLDYNNAQQKAAVSNTTMDRLKNERKQIDIDMKKEAC